MDIRAEMNLEHCAVDSTSRFSGPFLFFPNQEMERVWSQYERMESELSVIRSHLQHICNFGVPQVFVHYDLDAFLNIHEGLIL